MPHTHEGGLRHEHEDGHVTHDHGEGTTATRRYGAEPVRERVVAHEEPGYVAPPPYGVRGGFSFGSILTGVAVALGAMLLFAAVIGGIVAGVGLDEATAGEVTQLGWGAAIGLIVAQLLAYLWGGYTAGRMARGLGWLNGVMVPIVAILLALLIGLLIQAMGADAGVNVPYGAAQVPVGFDLDELRNIGLVAGIGSLVAMFVGGIFGGMLGARWHDKLEARLGVEEPHLRAA